MSAGASWYRASREWVSAIIVPAFSGFNSFQARYLDGSAGARYMLFTHDSTVC